MPDYRAIKTGSVVEVDSLSLDRIDFILRKLEWANIAFNAPSTLKLGELADIHLLLSPNLSIEELQIMVAGRGEVEGARIQVSNDMEATLSGSGFKIESIMKDRRAVGSTEPVEWKWRIEPTQVGTLQLHLVISVYLYVGNRTTPYVIRTFDRIIEVSITPIQRLKRFFTHNWQWLGTAVLTPIIGWLIYKQRKRYGSLGKKKEVKRVSDDDHSSDIPTWLLWSDRDEPPVPGLLNESRKEMYQALTIFHNHVKYVIYIMASMPAVILAIMRLWPGEQPVSRLYLIAGIILFPAPFIGVISIFIIRKYYQVYVSALVFATRVHLELRCALEHPWLERTIRQAQEWKQEVDNARKFLDKRATSFKDTFMLYSLIIACLSMASFACGIVFLYLSVRYGV